MWENMETISSLYKLLRVEAEFVSPIPFLKEWVKLMECNYWNCPLARTYYKSSDIPEYFEKEDYFCWFIDDVDYCENRDKYRQKLLNGIKAIIKYEESKCQQ